MKGEMFESPNISYKASGNRTEDHSKGKNKGQEANKKIGYEVRTNIQMKKQKNLTNVKSTENLRAVKKSPINTPLMFFHQEKSDYSQSIKEQVKT